MTNLLARLRHDWVNWGSPTDRETAVGEEVMAMDCKEAVDEIERLLAALSGASHCENCGGLIVTACLSCGRQDYRNEAGPAPSDAGIAAPTARGSLPNSLADMPEAVGRIVRLGSCSVHGDFAGYDRCPCYHEPAPPPLRIVR